MRFGLSLISFVYNPERAVVVSRALQSLARTITYGLGRPILDISCGPSEFDYESYRKMLSVSFDVRILPDPPEVQKPDVGHITALAAAMRLLRDYPDVTHVCCLVDDYVYNPAWMERLSALIQRHPVDTRAWSVFRSRYTDYHRIIGGDGTDVLMSMHDSIGCVARVEMQEFCALNCDHQAPDVTHAHRRPGNRWATSRDYMENIARHYDRGIGDVDCAIDFVGEE